MPRCRDEEREDEPGPVVPDRHHEAHRRVGHAGTDGQARREHGQGPMQLRPMQVLAGDPDGERDERIAEPMQRPRHHQPGEVRHERTDERPDGHRCQRADEHSPPQPSVGQPGDDRGGNDPHEQAHRQRPLGRLERDVQGPVDRDDDRVAQARDDRAAESGIHQAGDQPARWRSGRQLSRGYAALFRRRCGWRPCRGYAVRLLGR